VDVGDENPPVGKASELIDSAPRNTRRPTTNTVVGHHCRAQIENRGCSSR
jgi:hypothetical protein